MIAVIAVVVLLASAPGCGGSEDGPHTIAERDHNTSMQYVPCFASQLDYLEWQNLTRNASADKKYNFEQENALWLQPGDKVNVTSHDDFAVVLSIVATDEKTAQGNSEVGKICYTTDDGSLFSD